MSKITIIGGDLIEEIGGSYRIFAKEGYEISSNKEVIFNAKDGILYGTNGEAPAFNNTIVDFYVDVFRSKLQIPDNYGLKDSDFKGTFGFDRYNETTSGKGKQSLSGFEEMGFNGNKYYAPWLCLWPPKKHLEAVTEIDKSYSPVTSAKLTFKICEGNVKSGNAKFTISSNHSNLKIDGAEKIEKQGAINSSLEITISCDGVLEKDVDVEIKNETGIVIGKLKVVKNTTIYIANTKFITVMEEEKATTSVSKQQKREAEKTQFQNLIRDVIVYLNKNSLNQALIYVKGSVEDIFVIDKGEIIRNRGEGAYSISVTDPYFEGKRQEIDNKNIGEKEEKELDKAIKDLYYALEKYYKKNRKNQYFCEDTVDNANTEFITFRDKYQKYLYITQGNRPDKHPRDKNVIYVFVDKELNTLSTKGMDYYGYTFGPLNSAFVFNQHVKERKFGTFAHEIAHSLGAQHTFELNEQHYYPNTNLNRQIDSKKEEIKNSSIKNENYDLSKVKSDFKNEIDTRFKNLVIGLNADNGVDYQTNISGQKSFKGIKNYYERVDNAVNNILRLKDQEHSIKNDANSLGINQDYKVALQNEINELQKNLKSNENKYIDVSRSMTEENFMDYDYTDNIDSSTQKSIPNPNFEPKSFWKWQWDELRDSKHLVKKGLK